MTCSVLIFCGLIVGGLMVWLLRMRCLLKGSLLVPGG